MADKTYLLIPFELKDDLKKTYKIKWDAKLKLWFVDKMEEGLNKYKIVPMDIRYDDKDFYKSKLKSLKWDAAKRNWICSVEDSMKLKNINLKET